MKTEKRTGLDIRLPKKKAFSVKVPRNLPSLHGVFLGVAKRGSGKSVSITNLVRMYQDGSAMDRIFLITPTYYSNKEIWEPLGIQSEDVFHEATDDALTEVIRRVEEENEEYEEYHRKKKLYDELMKLLKSGMDIYNIPDTLMLEFFDHQAGTFVKPTHRYGGKRPVMGCILDDLQGSRLMRPHSPLANLVIKHRHIGKGLGISLFFAVQSYKAQQGINKAIRGNVTTMMLWRTKNEKELQDIVDECAGDIPPERFLKAYHYATAEPHGFLLIDFHPRKKDHPSGLRKNFDEFLLMSESVPEAKAAALGR